MVKISNREELESWLEGKPVEWSQVLAARISLRILPLIIVEFEKNDLFSEDQLKLILASFRATFISWAACKYPAHDMKTAASTAAIASADAASTSFATYASVDAASTTDASTAATYASFAASFASTAAASADAAFWALINIDCATLQGYTPSNSSALRMLTENLWRVGQKNPSAPDWFSERLISLEQAVGKNEDNWHVWMDWYRSVLQNRPCWGLGSDNVEKLVARIAQQEEEFWEQSVGEVNAEIAVWLTETKEAERKNSLSHKIFISYAHKDEDYARWITDVVDLTSYSTIVQYRDFNTGANFVREMQKALDNSDRMIALLSPEYEQSDHCQAEWAAFYNQDPSGKDRKLIPIMIKPTALNGLAKQVVYSSIYGLSPDRAKQKILTSIGFNGDIKTPNGWPGGDVLNELRGVGASVYDVQPDSNNQLQEKTSIVCDEDIAGFTPQQTFDEIKDQANDLCSRLQAETGNQFYSSDLIGRAKDWVASLMSSPEECNPLVLNKKIVWLLRTFAFDVANGNLAKADIVQMYVRDLQVYYKRLEVIFPNLKAYREANARDRFELPTDVENESFKIVLEFFGDKDSSGEIFTDLLVQSLHDVGDDRKAADEIFATDDSEEARNIRIEAEFDAGNRTVAIWRWIANSKSLLGKGGKSADELAKTIDKYDKAYKALEPHMEKVMGYLSRWMF